MIRIHRGLNVLTDLTAYAAGACVILMMLHVTLDVIFRAFLNMPLTGTITFVANYYMVFLVCLPLAFVERLDAHISVDVVTSRMPERFRRHLHGWTFAFTALVFGVTAYATSLEAMSKFAIRAFMIEKDMAISTWFGYFALPVGYGLLTLYLLLKFFAYLIGRPIQKLQLDTGDDLLERAHD